MFVPFFNSCKSNYLTLTFTNITENSKISISDLPIEKQQKVKINSLFKGLPAQNNLIPVEYRTYVNDTVYENIYINQKLTKNLNIEVVWDYEANYLTEYQTFNSLIAKIKMLEELSIQYNEEKGLETDAMVRVLQYIRAKKYSGMAWNTVGGSVESAFNQYVEQNQPVNINLSELQYLGKFTNPKTKEEIDFIHLMAVLNVILKGDNKNIAYKDLASWGGDICQLAIELKKTSLTGSELQVKANEMFNNKTSTFSCYDLLADIDAYNLASLYYKLEKNSISDTLEQYYKLGSYQNRNTTYLKYCFPEIFEDDETNPTKVEFINHMLERLNSNTLIGLWCYTEGYPYPSLSEQISASLTAFANYFME